MAKNISIFKGDRVFKGKTDSGFECVPREKFCWEGAEDVFGKDSEMIFDEYPTDQDLVLKYQPKEILKRLVIERLAGENCTWLLEHIHTFRHCDTRLEFINSAALSVFHLPPDVLEFYIIDLHQNKSELLTYFLCLLEYQIVIRSQGSENQFNVDLPKFFAELLFFEIIDLNNLINLRKK